MVTQYELKTAKGQTVRGTRHATITAAKREYSAAQRKAHGIRVFALPGGGYDAFPLGHPVPAGAEAVEEVSRG